LNAIKEIQKHAPKLKGLIYLFEEYTEQDAEYDEDEAKKVRFYLPLPISLYASHVPAISAGNQNNVDFDLVDVAELEFRRSGSEFGAWHPHYRPVFTIACAQESEIEEALENLRKSRELLDSYLRQIDRNLLRWRR
jgi:hypothetical protein